MTRAVLSLQDLHNACWKYKRSLTRTEIFAVCGCFKRFLQGMSSREEAKMGDILATEADLLGMIKEVTAFLRMHTEIEREETQLFSNKPC